MDNSSLADWLIIVAAFAAIALLWLFLTWWHAPEQQTFKVTLQNALRDIVEIFRLVEIWRWMQFNGPGLAVVALDLVSTLDPALRQSVFGNLFGALALLAVNVLARLKGPVTRTAGGPGADTMRAVAA